MEYQRDFKGIWIPKEIWIAKNLTLLEKIVLVEIDSLDNDNNGCYASNKYFADFFGLTNGRISQIINSLLTKNYIKIDYIYGKKNIEKRIIKINKPPYPEVFNKLNRVFNKLKGGYLENDKDNNIYISNNINNIVRQVIDYLNEKANKHFKYTETNSKHIKARLNDGFVLDDFKKVIDSKIREWLGNEKMNLYLRPETLFGSKFESYLNKKNNLPKWFDQKIEKEEISEEALKELQEMMKDFD